MSKEDIVYVPASVETKPDREQLYHIYYEIDIPGNEYNFPTLLGAEWFKNGEWEQPEQGKVIAWLKPVKLSELIAEEVEGLKSYIKKQDIAYTEMQAVANNLKNELKKYL